MSVTRLNMFLSTHLSIDLVHTYRRTVWWTVERTDENYYQTHCTNDHIRSEIDKIIELLIEDNNTRTKYFYKEMEFGLFTINQSIYLLSAE